jgi:general nucleoside transport system permease protein
MPSAHAWRIVALIAGAAALIVGILILGGFPAGTVLLGLLDGAFGNADKIGKTLKEMTPLLIAGVAVFIALRAGLFNIGVEGQFMIGAMVCAVIALAMPGPLGMILGILGGAVGGALWAYPAALIKAYRNGHEVITTIMLNNIAAHFTTALVAGPIKDATQQGTTTASIPRLMPNVIGPSNAPDATFSPTSVPAVNLSLLIGLFLVGLVWVWLKKRVSGFEHEAVGANPGAATLAGIATRKVLVRAMLLSGGVGGIAGAIQVLAFEGRFYKDFSQGYGFDSLGVALLAGSNPFGLIPAALIFGAIKKGAATIGVLHTVPKGITLLILGVTIVVFAAIRYRKHVGRAHD